MCGASDLPFDDDTFGGVENMNTLQQRAWVENHLDCAVSPAFSNDLRRQLA